MTIFKPTQEDLDFYSVFPSYNYYEYKGVFRIYISDNDLYCPFKVVKIKKVKKDTNKKVYKKKTDIILSKNQIRYNNYVERAIKKGCIIEFSYEEFLLMIEDKCTYCGEKGYSVDRIDSKGCYTKDNIQPICIKCNTMKYTYCEKDFLDHVNKIYSFIHS